MPNRARLVRVGQAGGPWGRGDGAKIARWRALAEWPAFDFVRRSGYKYLI